MRTNVCSVSMLGDLLESLMRLKRDTPITPTIVEYDDDGILVIRNPLLESQKTDTQQLKDSISLHKEWLSLEMDDTEWNADNIESLVKRTKAVIAKLESI